MISIIIIIIIASIVVIIFIITIIIMIIIIIITITIPDAAWTGLSTYSVLDRRASSRWSPE